MTDRIPMTATEIIQYRERLFQEVEAAIHQPIIDAIVKTINEHRAKLIEQKIGGKDEGG